MREIVLDTETTGLDPQSGHRVVEIGCVELSHHLPTGNTFHVYINPERGMPDEAFRVHGLSVDFLKKHSVFSEIVEGFLDFIKSDTLIIHNAEFDLRFLNSELGNCGRPPIPGTRAIDTVALARAKFPGSPANLDALCRRFEIDNSNRDKHGALLDSQLLSEVYLELIGGRQPDLVAGAAENSGNEKSGGPNKANLNMAEGGARSGTDKKIRPPRPHAPSQAEAEAHATMLGLVAEPLWKN